MISLLLIPFMPSNTLLLAEPTTNIVWNATVYCDESGGSYDFVVFGEALDANDGPPYDSYDVAKAPAPLPPYIRTWFNDNLPSPYDLLWNDYRQYPDTEKIWNLTIQWIPTSGSSPTSVTIHWNTNEVDDSEYVSMTLCNDSGAPLKNMLLDSAYSFICPAYVPQYFTIVCVVINLPPATPQKPTGETSGKIGVEYSYSTATTDPNNDQLFYQWNWGDGAISTWLGPFASGQTSQAQHTWTTKGNYGITVKAKDIYGAETDWSDPLPITMPSSQNFTINEMATFLFNIIRFYKNGYISILFVQISRMEG